MSTSRLIVELEQRMRQAGFNQKSLASAADLNETYVRDILKGKSKNPEAARLAKLAAALGCSVNDLIGSPPPTNQSKLPAAIIGPQASEKALHAAQERILLEIWRSLSLDQREHLIGLLEATRRLHPSDVA